MTAPSHEYRRPRALRPGDRIGVVSIASRIEATDLQAGCEELRSLGYEPVVSSAALASDGEFAGTPQQRARAFLEMWEDPAIHAIIATRGGYGANYLLPILDFPKLARRPKILIGYSDMTSLHAAFQRAGMVTFHGPMVAKDFAHKQVDAETFRAAVGGERVSMAFGADSPVRTLVAGHAHGQFCGGCLSIVVTTLGTFWEIDTRNKILFLEDVCERPFRIDRMLMHLKLAGKFDDVRGVVFGQMLQCEAGPEEEPLEGVARRILGDLNVPIAFGLSSGHVSGANLTLPFGVPAELRCEARRVTLDFEPATLAAWEDKQ